MVLNFDCFGVQAAGGGVDGRQVVLTVLYRYLLRTVRMLAGYVAGAYND